MEQPSYYAIIPAEIRYDKDLRAGAKIFYGEITALCSKVGVCTASNNYFADLYGVTASGISRWVTQLKDKGYINVEYEKEGKEIKKRFIKLNLFATSNQTIEHVLTNINGVVTKNQEGYCQKSKDNNTSINNKKENIKENSQFGILFNKFWNAYPKRKNKGDVEKWFLKHKPSEDLVNTMIEKIELLKKTDQWKKDNGQFIPYPSTWLNAKGWEDEIEISSKPKSEKRFFN